MQCVKSAKDERYGPVSATFRDHTIAEDERQLTSHTAFYEVWPMPGAVITVICAADDGWSYHPKHAEQITEI